MFFKRRAKLR